MIRIFLLAVLTLGNCNSAFSESDSEMVDALLSSASDTSLSHSRRVGMMEKAARKDKTGRAMHAFARYYLNQNTVLSRQFARQWLRRAIKHAKALKAEKRGGQMGYPRNVSYFWDSSKACVFLRV